jgi:hypothetical protein
VDVFLKHVLLILHQVVEVLVQLDHQTHQFLEEHVVVSSDSKPMLLELDVLLQEHQDQ